jgi:lysophospholipase L1-like esterase
MSMVARRSASRRAAPGAAWRSPCAMARLGTVLILLGFVAAGIGRRELFDLRAEDPARSIHRFASGAAEVEVTTQMPWSRVPAVLPGSADAWAGGSAHSIVMRPAFPAHRALRLYVQPGRAPAELPATSTPTGETARLRILVNGERLGTFAVPTPTSPSPGRTPPPLPRLVAPIPAAALGEGTSLQITLLNEGPPGLGLRRVRLIETVPTFSLGQLGLRGRFSPVSASILAIGLGLLLRARLLSVVDGTRRRAARSALGPGLGLLILGLAVAAPVATRGVPRWAWLLLVLGVLPLGRRPPRPTPVRGARAPRLPKVAGNTLLLLVGLAVALVAGELALRMVFRDEPWARVVLHTPTPGPALGAPVNSLGFNEREVSVEKPPGVYRIAVLGDSLSVSAPRGQRFGDVIAARLNTNQSRSLTYESMSFGRTGADTNVETEILQQVVWRAKPDFVLLEFYVNDLENGDHSDRPEGYPLIPGGTAPARWVRALTDRMLLRRMLEEQFQTLQDRLGLAESYPAYMYRRFGDPDGAHWQAAAYELRDFIRECREHRTPLAIALFPHLSAGLPAGAYEFQELYDQVMVLCRQEGVPCVDLRSTYAPYWDYTSLWVTRFDPHPNALAHRLAGERLVEALGQVWLDAGHPRPAGGPGEPAAPILHPPS